jgi:hypothetical protein
LRQRHWGRRAAGGTALFWPATQQKFIHFLDKNCYSYHDLRGICWRASDDPGSGPVLVLHFAEAVITEVEIQGRNLDIIHYYIGAGLMPWVWEQPEGIRSRSDKVAVITRITISKVE